MFELVTETWKSDSRCRGVWAKVGSVVRSYTKSSGRQWLLGVAWDMSELGVNWRSLMVWWWNTCEGVSVATRWMVTMRAGIFFVLFCFVSFLAWFYSLNGVENQVYFDHRCLKYVLRPTRETVTWAFGYTHFKI